MTSSSKIPFNGRGENVPLCEGRDGARQVPMVREPPASALINGSTGMRWIGVGLGLGGRNNYKGYKVTRI